MSFTVGIFLPLLLPTWLLLGLARLAVLTVPFRWIAPWLGQQAGTTPVVPPVTDGQADMALAIGRSIRIAACYTPWDSLCQPQALVARFWLARYGIPCVVNYGVKRNDAGGLDAHAWVCAGPVAVTGGDAGQDFTVVRSFIEPAGTGR